MLSASARLPLPPLPGTKAIPAKAAYPSCGAASRSGADPGEFSLHQLSVGQGAQFCGFRPELANLRGGECGGEAVWRGNQRLAGSCASRALRIASRPDAERVRVVLKPKCDSTSMTALQIPALLTPSSRPIPA